MVAVWTWLRVVSVSVTVAPGSARGGGVLDGALDRAAERELGGGVDGRRPVRGDEQESDSAAGGARKGDGG